MAAHSSSSSSLTSGSTTSTLTTAPHTVTCAVSSTTMSTTSVNTTALFSLSITAASYIPAPSMSTSCVTTSSFMPAASTASSSTATTYTTSAAATSTVTCTTTTTRAVIGATASVTMVHANPSCSITGYIAPSTSSTQCTTTDDQVEFFRSCRAIVDLGSDILRYILNRNVLPVDLPREVQKFQRKLPKLNTCQTILINNAPTKGYKDFDVSLLCRLLGNICPSSSVPPPANGWWSNTMPTATCTTLGDDILRVRLLRNEAYGHVSDTADAGRCVGTVWNEMKGICSKMDARFGTSYSNDLATLQTTEMDSQAKRRHDAEISKKNSKIKAKKRRCDTLTRDLEEKERESGKKKKRKRKVMKSNISKRWCLMQNGSQDRCYIRRRKVEDECLHILHSTGILIITGQTGSGKTTLCHEIIHQLVEGEGCSVYVLKEPDEWPEVNTSGLKDIVLFIDDFCDRATAEMNTYEKWEKHLQSLFERARSNDISLIISIESDIHSNIISRDTLFKEAKKSCINLSCKTWSLTCKEKKKFFEMKYEAEKKIKPLSLGERDIDAICKTNPIGGFFNACLSFFEFDENYRSGSVYFKNSQTDYLKRIEKMFIESFSQYAILVYALLMGSVCEDSLDNNLFRQLSSDYGTGNVTSQIFKSNLDSLLKRNLLKVWVGSDSYRISNNLVKSAILKTFVTNYKESFLDHVDGDFVFRYVRGNDYKRMPGEICVCLHSDYYEPTARKLLSYFIYSSGTSNMYDPSDDLCLTQPICDDKHFLKVFFEEIKQRWRSNELAERIIEILYRACFIGKIPLIEELLSIFVVNDIEGLLMTPEIFEKALKEVLNGTNTSCLTIKCLLHSPFGRLTPAHLIQALINKLCDLSEEIETLSVRNILKVIVLSEEQIVTLISELVKKIPGNISVMDALFSFSFILSEESIKDVISDCVLHGFHVHEKPMKHLLRRASDLNDTNSIYKYILDQYLSFPSSLTSMVQVVSFWRRTKDSDYLEEMYELLFIDSMVKPWYEEFLKNKIIRGLLRKISPKQYVAILIAGLNLGLRQRCLDLLCAFYGNDHSKSDQALCFLLELNNCDNYNLGHAFEVFFHSLKKKIGHFSDELLCACICAVCDSRVSYLKTDTAEWLNNILTRNTISNSTFHCVLSKLIQFDRLSCLKMKDFKKVIRRTDNPELSSNILGRILIYASEVKLTDIRIISILLTIGDLQSFDYRFFIRILKASLRNKRTTVIRAILNCPQFQELLDCQATSQHWRNILCSMFLIVYLCTRNEFKMLSLLETTNKIISELLMINENLDDYLSTIICSYVRIGTFELRLIIRCMVACYERNTRGPTLLNFQDLSERISHDSSIGNKLIRRLLNIPLHVLEGCNVHCLFETCRPRLEQDTVDAALKVASSYPFYFDLLKTVLSKDLLNPSAVILPSKTISEAMKAITQNFYSSNLLALCEALLRIPVNGIIDASDTADILIGITRNLGDRDAYNILKYFLKSHIIAELDVSSAARVLSSVVEKLYVFYKEKFASRSLLIDYLLNEKSHQYLVAMLAAFFHKSATVFKGYAVVRFVYQFYDRLGDSIQDAIIQALYLTTTQTSGNTILLDPSSSSKEGNLLFFLLVVVLCSKQRLYSIMCFEVSVDGNIDPEKKTALKMMKSGLCIYTAELKKTNSVISLTVQVHPNEGLSDIFKQNQSSSREVFTKLLPFLANCGKEINGCVVRKALSCFLCLDNIKYHNGTPLTIKTSNFFLTGECTNVLILFVMHMLRLDSEISEAGFCNTFSPAQVISGGRKHTAADVPGNEEEWHVQCIKELSRSIHIEYVHGRSMDDIFKSLLNDDDDETLYPNFRLYFQVQYILDGEQLISRMTLCMENLEIFLKLMNCVDDEMDDIYFQVYPDLALSQICILLSALVAKGRSNQANLVRRSTSTILWFTFPLYTSTCSRKDFFEKFLNVNKKEYVNGLFLVLITREFTDIVTEDIILNSLCQSVSKASDTKITLDVDDNENDDGFFTLILLDYLLFRQVLEHGNDMQYTVSCRALPHLNFGRRVSISVRKMLTTKNWQTLYTVHIEQKEENIYLCANLENSSCTESEFATFTFKQPIFSLHLSLLKRECSEFAQTVITTKQCILFLDCLSRENHTYLLSFLDPNTRLITEIPNLVSSVVYDFRAKYIGQQRQSCYIVRKIIESSSDSFLFDYSEKQKNTPHDVKWCRNCLSLFLDRVRHQNTCTDGLLYLLRGTLTFAYYDLFEKLLMSTAENLQNCHLLEILEESIRVTNNTCIRALLNIKHLSLVGSLDSLMRLVIGENVEKQDAFEIFENLVKSEHFNEFPVGDIETLIKSIIRYDTKLSCKRMETIMASRPFGNICEANLISLIIECLVEKQGDIRNHEPVIVEANTSGLLILLSFILSNYRSIDGNLQLEANHKVSGTGDIMLAIDSDLPLICIKTCKHENGSKSTVTFTSALTTYKNGSDVCKQLDTLISSENKLDGLILFLLNSMSIMLSEHNFMELLIKCIKKITTSACSVDVLSELDQQEPDVSTLKTILDSKHGKTSLGQASLSQALKCTVVSYLDSCAVISLILHHPVERRLEYKTLVDLCLHTINVPQIRADAYIEWFMDATEEISFKEDDLNTLVRECLVSSSDQSRSISKILSFCENDGTKEETLIRQLLDLLSVRQIGNSSTLDGIRDILVKQKDNLFLAVALSACHILSEGKALIVQIDYNSRKDADKTFVIFLQLFLKTYPQSKKHVRRISKSDKQLACLLKLQIHAVELMIKSSQNRFLQTFSTFQISSTSSGGMQDSLEIGIEIVPTTTISNDIVMTFMLQAIEHDDSSNPFIFVLLETISNVILSEEEIRVLLVAMINRKYEGRQEYARALLESSLYNRLTENVYTDVLRVAFSKVRDTRPIIELLLLDSVSRECKLSDENFQILFSTLCECQHKRPIVYLKMLLESELTPPMSDDTFIFAVSSLLSNRIENADFVQTILNYKSTISNDCRRRLEGLKVPPKQTQDESDDDDDEDVDMEKEKTEDYKARTRKDTYNDKSSTVDHDRNLSHIEVHNVQESAELERRTLFIDKIMGHFEKKNWINKQSNDKG